MFPEVGNSCTPTFFERKGLMEIAATVDAGAIVFMDNKPAAVVNYMNPSWTFS
jgi:hypothetical protein